MALSAGVITNTAEVIQSSVPDPDSIPGNGTPVEDDFTSAFIVAQVAPSADLQLTKIAVPETVGVTQLYPFLLRVENKGPDNRN